MADKIGAGQRHFAALNERAFDTYTIFEGTSEIQRLIVSRAISGVHIS